MTETTRHDGEHEGDREGLRDPARGRRRGGAPAARGPSGRAGALTAVNDLRTRVDDLAKKVRGIDALEARVAKLEKEIAALKKAKTPARRQTPRKPADPQSKLARLRSRSP